MKNLLSLLLVVLLAAGCKKEKVYTFEVDDVAVEQPGANKPNVKTDVEFISIAYTDLVGSTISPDDAEALGIAYASFGDKTVIIDMIIRNFLKDPSLNIPSEADMRADPDGFVRTAYQKLFVREPTEFEEWKMSRMIERDTSITPSMVYFSFMTSDEYRFY